MHKVEKFIQLFRFDPLDKDHDKFEYVTINTKKIHLVEWHEDWDMVAIVCKTDNPNEEECFIEDYGDPKEARKRYHDLMHRLGASDGTAYQREELMRKAMKENAKTHKWFQSLIAKAKEAGYNPFADQDDDEEGETLLTDPECAVCSEDCAGCPESRDQAREVDTDGGEAPAGTEGHLD